MEGKTVSVLWQDYQFLTKEMCKFLTRQDLDIFYELLNQREKLQALIDRTTDPGFRFSPAGRHLLNDIQQDNEAIRQDLQVRLVNSKRQLQVLEVYNTLSTTAVSEKNWNG